MSAKEKKDAGKLYIEKRDPSECSVTYKGKEHLLKERLYGADLNFGEGDHVTFHYGVKGVDGHISFKIKKITKGFALDLVGQGANKPIKLAIECEKAGAPKSLVKAELTCSPKERSCKQEKIELKGWNEEELKTAIMKIRLTS